MYVDRFATGLTYIEPNRNFRTEVSVVDRIKPLVFILEQGVWPTMAPFVLYRSKNGCGAADLAVFTPYPPFPNQQTLPMPLTAFVALLARFPRRFFAFTALLCIGLLSFGMYLQHVVGLEPCPMCIVQRYTLVLVALVAAMGAAWPGRVGQRLVAVLMVLLSGFGIFVAARQSWLQWYPPETATCGRDFYGMIESFPLQRAIPMIFKGSGDCTAVDWTFLTLSIANWSFLNFCFIGVLTLVMLWGSFTRD